MNTRCRVSPGCRRGREGGRPASPARTPVLSLDFCPLSCAWRWAEPPSPRSGRPGSIIAPLFSGTPRFRGMFPEPHPAGGPPSAFLGASFSPRSHPCSPGFPCCGDGIPSRERWVTAGRRRPPDPAHVARQVSDAGLSSFHEQRGPG